MKLHVHHENFESRGHWYIVFLRRHNFLGTFSKHRDLEDKLPPAGILTQAPGIQAIGISITRRGEAAV